MSLFLVLLALWIFRDPKQFPGIGSLFKVESVPTPTATHHTRTRTTPHPYHTTLEPHQPAHHHSRLALILSLYFLRVPPVVAARRVSRTTRTRRVAMLVAVLAVSAAGEGARLLCCPGRDRSQPPRKRRALMDWRSMQEKFPGASSFCSVEDSPWLLVRSTILWGKSIRSACLRDLLIAPVVPLDGRRWRNQDLLSFLLSCHGKAMIPF